jgi:hypothetical protein
MRPTPDARRKKPKSTARIAEHQQWSDQLSQLDERLARIQRLLEKQNLAPAITAIRGLCEEMTRSEDTNQAMKLLNEPGKVLLPDWKGKYGVVQTLVFDCLAASELLTKAAALDLHDVSFELVRFLRDGSTAVKRSQIAPDAANAIKRYLSERGWPKRRGPKVKHDPANDKKLLAEWERAKGAGVTREDFCNSRGISVKQFTDAQGRLRYLKGKKLPRPKPVKPQ